MQLTKKRSGVLIIFFILLALIVSFIRIFFGLAVYYGIKFSASLPQNTQGWIEYNTEIAIPQDFQLVFEYNGDHGWSPGRAVEYYVFKLENEPTEWLEENKFSNEANEDFEEVINKFVPESIQTEISTEYVSDFTDTYYWLKAPDLYYFAYQPDRMMLMVFAQPW